MDLIYRTDATGPREDSLSGPKTYPLALRMWQYCGLLGLTVVVRYFSPEIVQVLFYLTLLVMYFMSRDEAFWLAVFLALTTGFMGFFGKYEAVITMIPGLPAIEVAQFYIILSLVKAFSTPKTYRPFYSTFLIVLLIYIIFLIAQGFTVGFPPGLNRKFALVKVMLPLGLLYSIPILFDRIEKYRHAFSFLFIISFSALLSQLFSISMGGVTPSQFVGATGHEHLFFDVTEGMTYRGSFSEPIVVITMLGAMVFIAMNKGKNSGLLFAVLAANFASTFLSATRGVVVSLTFMLCMFVLLVLQLNAKRMLGLLATFIVMYSLSTAIPTVNMQLHNAVDRMMTLEALAEGDVTADGTLKRISQRGPRVMKMWSQSKLTGFGFSEIFREYGDIHVGNQTILLHGGIVGLLLLYGFFANFNFKLWLKSQQLRPGDPYKKSLLAFIIFFVGWFLIHSSSGQQFGFAYEPQTGIQLALFFGMGSLMYHQSDRPAISGSRKDST